MNLLSIEAFVLVADYGSFSKASKASFTSVPTLSKRLKALEQELGVTLISRSGNHGLTAEGRALISHARKVTQSVRALENAARETQGLATGRVVVGYSGGSSLEEDIMARVIANLNRRYPDLVITPQIGTDPVLLDLMKTGDVDLAFHSHGIPKRDDVSFVRLGAPRLQALLPKSHPLAHKMSLSLKELDGETFAVSRREDFPAVTDFLEDLLRQKGMTKTRLQVIDSYHAIPTLTASGQLISFVSAWHVPISNPTLASVTIRDKEAVCPVSILWLKENSNPAVTLFVEEAQRVVAEKYGPQPPNATTSKPA